MSSTPRPAPKRCSATAPRLASLPMKAGMPAGLLDERAERGIRPLEVRRQAHEPVGCPDQAGHGEPDRHDARATQRVGPPSIHDARDELGRLGRRHEVVHLVALAHDDGAVESDGRDRDRVDLGVHRDGDHAGMRRDHGRRASHAVGGIGRALLDEPRLDELRRERGDGRAVEPGRRRQPGARERPLEVHQPEEFREVSTVHPVEGAGSLCHATTLGAPPNRVRRDAPNMLRLTPNARARSIRGVQITFDVGVETFERFNDEQTQHHTARHAGCRGRTGRRHARRVRSRRG